MDYFMLDTSYEVSVVTTVLLSPGTYIFTHAQLQEPTLLGNWYWISLRKLLNHPYICRAFPCFLDYSSMLISENAWSTPLDWKLKTEALMAIIQHLLYPFTNITPFANKHARIVVHISSDSLLKVCWENKGF